LESACRAPRSITPRLPTKLFDFLTQLFFDDTLTDSVYAQAPYNARGARATRNATDNIYGSDGATLLLSVKADGAGG
jgi:hypothetical protein